MEWYEYITIEGMYGGARWFGYILCICMGGSYLIPLKKDTNGLCVFRFVYIYTCGIQKLH